MTKKGIFSFFFIIIAFTTFAQTKPRIAVLPFEAINVSDGEARAVSSIFETALVNTLAFDVLEQNQFRQILEAQAFSLSGCTDEACAIEVGKILSAEQIVLGSLSRIETTYVLTARLIDVTLGRNLRAADIEAERAGDLPDKARATARVAAPTPFCSGTLP